MKRNLMQKLVAWKTNADRKPLILRGARQVGKTYILKEFGSRFFSNIHYLNFEEDPRANKLFETDLRPKRIISDLSFLMDRSINIEQDLVIFDEVQACPPALTSLKYFQEQLPELALTSAGSLLGLQLNSASYPVGKVDHLNLYPLSFTEFLTALEDTHSLEIIENLTLDTVISPIVHEHLWNRLKWYFVVGGMPEAVSLFAQDHDDLYTALKNVRLKQKDLILAYMADVAKHSGKQNAMHIERILNSVPAQLNRMQDSSTSRFRFRGVVPGISHYSRLVGAIDWLEKAGLIYKASIIETSKIPLQAYVRENFFKMFLFDVGLLGCMAGLDPKVIQDYDYGSYKGYFAENFVAQELISSGVENLVSWHKKQAEVEFLIKLNGDIIPIEVKSGWVTRAKSLKIFCDKYSPPYRIILSGKPLSIDSKSGVRKIPLYLTSILNSY